MSMGPSRRQWLAGVPLAAAAGLTSCLAAQAKEKPVAEPFGYCLNTATIQGQKLSLIEEIEIAAKTGYQGFEPWVGELDKHVKSGGSLKDVAARLRDFGLKVESAIAFSEWIVDDEGRRKKGLEEAK